MNRSSRTRGQWRRRWRILHRRIFACSFFADLNFSIEEDELALDALEDRVSAIEETIAARWPRSMVLRRRLGRQLRASAATFAWAGPDFATRRAEAMSEDIHVRGLPRGLRAEVAAGRPYKRPRRPR